MVYSHWLGREPGLGQGPGRASINQWKHFQDLKNGYQTHSSVPENVASVLIKKILPGPGPCPGPDSGPSQCEYTIKGINFDVSTSQPLALAYEVYDSYVMTLYNSTLSRASL